MPPNGANWHCTSQRHSPAGPERTVASQQDPSRCPASTEISTVTIKSVIHVQRLAQSINGREGPNFHQLIDSQDTSSSG